MTGHTPGPWHIDWNGGMAPRILGLHRPGRAREIAVVQFHNGSDDPNVHGNARLIAAAPETAAERDRLREVNAELLEALRVCVRAIGKTDEYDADYAAYAADRADAAIAKANDAG